MRFDQLPIFIAEYLGVPKDRDLRFLPQFYRADTDMLWRLGGEYLRKLVPLPFLREWKYVSIDSRLSMLMQGMYPCIPGWHCDDFHRPDRAKGQPDLSTVEQESPSEHLMLIIGDCSKTRFVSESFDLDTTPQEGLSVYGEAHKMIEEIKPPTLVVEPGGLWRFGPLSWHRGEPATKPGWRYFIRITGSNHRQPLNELRTQTQVYMTDPFAGW